MSKVYTEPTLGHDKETLIIPEELKKFTPEQIKVVNEAVVMAEELVSEYYKISPAQWSRIHYDVKTLTELSSEEIAFSHFAQVIRYEGKRNHSDLGSSTFDFYKICLQDHIILMKIYLKETFKLFPFVLYIITHELVHIVRFCKFLQNYDALPEERIAEEIRVHKTTRQIMTDLKGVPGMEDVLSYFSEFSESIDGVGYSTNFNEKEFVE